MLFRETSIVKKQITPCKAHGMEAVGFCFVLKARHTFAGAWGFYFLGEI